MVVVGRGEEASGGGEAARGGAGHRRRGRRRRRRPGSGAGAAMWRRAAGAGLGLPGLGGGDVGLAHVAARDSLWRRGGRCPVGSGHVRRWRG